MSKYKVTRNIGGQRKYRGYQNWNEGDFVVGRVLAEYVDDYGHTGYELQVLEANFEEPEYEVKDGIASWNEGDVVGLNHAGSLAYKMRALAKELGKPKRDVNGNPVISTDGVPVYEVPRGTLVMVSYQGQEKLTTGKFKNKMAHSLEVAIVEEAVDEENVGI